MFDVIFHYLKKYFSIVTCKYSSVKKFSLPSHMKKPPDPTVDPNSFWYEHVKQIVEYYSKYLINNKPKSKKKKKYINCIKRVRIKNQHQFQTLDEIMISTTTNSKPRGHELKPISTQFFVTTWDGDGYPMESSKCDTKTAQKILGRKKTIPSYLYCFQRFQQLTDFGFLSSKKEMKLSFFGTVNQFYAVERKALLQVKNLHEEALRAEYEEYDYFNPHKIWKIDG